VTSRHVYSIVLLSLGVPLMVAACSPATRYRVLSFFFDGVPEPGQPGAETPGPEAPLPEPTGEAGAEVAQRPRIIAHAPYRENRCRACHDATTGLLVKEVRDGLCLECHPHPADGAPYIHGPLAVNDCVACHDYHASPYPMLLLEDIHTLCFRCHERADLSPDPHDAMTEEQTCLACHDPHGGADRFFLK
jgi:predicted CXXCH cytochrome family protein